MKIKTSELSGHALDKAVAECLGATEGYKQGEVFLWDGEPTITTWGHDIRFSPSTDWAQGGLIIEREFMEIRFEHECSWNSSPAQDMWVAVIPYKVKLAGQTPLIAAMRCFVFSKLGDEVEIPDELL